MKKIIFSLFILFNFINAQDIRKDAKISPSIKKTVTHKHKKMKLSMYKKDMQVQKDTFLLPEIPTKKEKINMWKIAPQKK